MGNKFHLINVKSEKLCICMDGRCTVNAFYAVFATIAGSTNYEKWFNYGVVIASQSQCMCYQQIGLTKNILV